MEWGQGEEGMFKCDANNYVLKVRLTAIKEGGKKARKKIIFMILLSVRNSEMICSKVLSLFHINDISEIVNKEIKIF